MFPSDFCIAGVVGRSDNAAVERSETGARRQDPDGPRSTATVNPGSLAEKRLQDRQLKNDLTVFLGHIEKSAGFLVAAFADSPYDVSDA